MAEVVAGWSVAPVIENGKSVAEGQVYVACEDGSVYQKPIGHGEWEAVPPVPGTPASQGPADPAPGS